ncbi:MAG: DUF3021 domain-containing protein [Clostridium sp.]|nr:DUF3021 domain-containing protein [Clostridium sp.]MCM1399675.1 DUF3021 domain-containing protein [Clostridium sp.]MCM1460535.1 DUF3021 domain-containing protein [Bacteroides sp.]
MLKRTLVKMINSFFYAIGITTVVYFFITAGGNAVMMLPEYREKFPNDVRALVVQLILIGCMSAVLGGGTVIMELEKISLVAQSIIYFVLAAAVWFFVGCYCWSMHKYTLSFVSTTASFVVSYVICWVIQYKICKKAVDDINKKLREMEGKEHE